MAAGARPGRIDLRNADLSVRSLARSDLRGADLRDADLAGADLHSADLAGADLTAANLTGALWSDGTLWPEELAPLMQSRSEELRPGAWRISASGNADVEAGGRLAPFR